MNDKKSLQQAIVAGGCFWCIEAPMQRLKGVTSAVSGYMGGKVKNPSYQQICSGTSGHAEVVVITFDQNTISYTQILQVFFALHDPTMLNQQGNDRGTQYRSAIFYQNEQQLKDAKQEIQSLTDSGEYNSAIVTTLEPEQKFYIADEGHQQYYDKNPYQPYCQIMIAPKLAKLEYLFADKLR
ncbi:peptide-methionine (S)-S-oxide reductase MsrA [Thalassotalea nanhaiensis]|uniref:Peptide methionine sulfoxide reductase MsrA n=1 Tax=Thalassotalea nanhaiensis TaxID=3065648 RepID=A0ABY9TGR3_9GAMM|nr:peptide-methionine (S)-S-oxide reductase MsrA [Colwelliaceae bacterium SQ345]